VDAGGAATTVPLALADLVVDEHQLLEAAAHGLDAVVLSAGASGDVELQVRVGAARLLGLDSLVRVGDEEELRRALWAGATLIGLSARASTRDDSGVLVALELAARVPPLVTAVAMAGTGLDPADVGRLAATRCDAVWARAGGARDAAGAWAALVDAARGPATRRP
jgi:indole-3-glycerol phosphate synthase